MNFKQKFINFLKWTEKYTKTDMIYLSQGGFWWIFGKTGTLLISLTIMTGFSHWISKETFGAYQYVLAMIAILSIFSLPGIDTALARAIARSKEGMFLLCAKTKFKWALIGAGICLATSFWYFFHQNFTLGISFLVAAVFLAFHNTFDLYLSFWLGKKRFDIQSKYLILSNLLAGLIFITVIFLTDNLVLIIFAFFASKTFFKAIFFKLTLKQVFNQETEKETIPFGKHLTLMGSVDLFGSQIDKIIIWQLLGPIAVAIYTFAQLPLLRAQELIPIGALALPKLSEKNVKEIKKELFQKFLKLFLVCVPFALFCILIAPFFYKFLFPPYLASIPYFQVLALTLILLPFGLLGTALLTEMKTKELYLLSFFTPILKIILFLALIPFYGIWGIVAAILISQIFNAGLALYFFKKI